MGLNRTPVICQNGRKIRTGLSLAPTRSEGWTYGEHVSSGVGRGGTAHSTGNMKACSRPEAGGSTVPTGQDGPEESVMLIPRPGDYGDFLDTLAPGTWATASVVSRIPPLIGVAN